MEFTKHSDINFAGSTYVEEGLLAVYGANVYDGVPSIVQEIRNYAIADKYADKLAEDLKTFTANVNQAIGRTGE